MEAVAIQRKTNDKAAKAAVAATPEPQPQAAVETGATAGMPLFLQAARGVGSAAPPPAPKAPVVQRMCKECSEELEQPLQPALTIGAVNDPLEQEADAVAGQVLRKASGAPVQSQATPAVQRRSVARLPIQRSCSRCAAKMDEQRPPPLQRKALGPSVQRLCAKCEEELQPKADGDGGGGMATGNVRSLIASPGAGYPVPGAVRSQTEPVLNADLSGVRVHSDARAQRAAADINAKAFTHGNNIYLGAGQSSNDLGLMAHELTHTVQQGASPGLQRIQRIEWPSVDDVVGGLEDAGEALGDAAESAWETGEELAEEAWETGEELVEGAGELAEEAIDTLHGIAQEVWDTANAIASAIGGMVSFSGGRLTITVPAFDACPVVPLQFSLPSQEIFIPIIEGAIPVHPLLAIYGAIGVNFAVTPELSAQLGPCRVHGLRLVIDPLGGSYSAAGWITVTTALGLGAEASVGARGEVGAIVIIPTVPPIPIPISAVGLEAGLAAQARAIVASTVDLKVAASYSGGTFSGALSADNDIGLGLDWGVGGYGQLDVLGINLCRLYWPLYEDHWDAGLHYNVDAAMTIGRGGFSAALSIGGFRPTPFSSFPLQLNRDVLADDCVLLDAMCAILTRLGQMPSQNGGAWTGHPEPYWPGPLEIYPRAPAIGSGAKCRGACGPDCDTCSPAEDLVHCEPRPAADGGEGHDLWVYPNYQECDSHQGCRDHDACYDWCGSGGPGGLGPLLCRRLCDFECGCNYPPYQCVGWIFGGEPHDSEMAFSDPPTSTGCDIPCPEGGEAAGAGGGVGGSPWVTCLDDYPLFDSHDVTLGPYHWSTGNIDLWEQLVWDIPPVTVELYARGEADAALNLGLGPAYLTDMCVTFDPDTGDYSGTAALVLDAFGEGVFGLTGYLGGGLDLLSFDFLRAACAEGYLRGEARPRLDISGRLESRLQGNGFNNGRVPVSCRGGGLTMDTGLTITPRLGLTFELSAGASVQLGFFEPLRLGVWNGGPWQLFEQTWSTEWEIDIDLPALAAGIMPAAVVTAQVVDLNALVAWLMDLVDQHVVEGDSPEEEELPGCGGTPPPPTPPTTPTCDEVVENPVTSDTAHGLGDISGQIDQTHWQSTTFSLPTGGSETVGILMESPYLTKHHAPGSNNTGPAQRDIYGFNKLPTNSAHGNSGFKKTQVYIKGHLLNNNIGGPVTGENLYPITGQANNPDHESQVERHVKRLVLNDELLVYYKVVVVDREPPELIDVFGDGTCFYYKSNADLDCTWATYKLCNGELLVRNPTQNRQIRSVFDVAGFIQNVRTKECPDRP